MILIIIQKKSKAFRILNMTDLILQTERFFVHQVLGPNIMSVCFVVQ